jgi:hypothetical protein
VAVVAAGAEIAATVTAIVTANDAIAMMNSD